MSADPAIYTGTHNDVAETLNKAADLIEERGWAKGNCAMLVGDGPLCLEGAIGAALDVRPYDAPMGTIYSYAVVHDSAAYAAVREYLGRSGREMAWSWNDDQTSAEPVIETLRAAAIIAAAQEVDVRVVAPEAELTAVSLADVAGAVV